MVLKRFGHGSLILTVILLMQDCVLWGLDQSILNKTKQVLQTAFQTGLYPSNFGGLQYAYILESSALKYGYRQFCYDLATFECSQKTYGKSSLESDMRTYLDELIKQGYLDNYRFDKPFWSDGMGGATVWVIYFTPGWNAMSDFEKGRKVIEKYEKGQDPKQQQSWSDQDSMTARELKQWVEEERAERIRREEAEKAELERAKREAEEKYGQSLKESEARIEAEKKKVKQMEEQEQRESKSQEGQKHSTVEDALWR